MINNQKEKIEEENTINLDISNSNNIFYSENNPNISSRSKKQYLAFRSKNIYQLDLIINNNHYIDRFKCGLCENICKDPRYQYCGCDSPYCKDCLDFYYDVFHHRCPKCQKETKELIPNETFNKSI